MVVAREHPDKLFDLSECELSQVPASLYSQCSVFLAETLLMHGNFLKKLHHGGSMVDLRNIRVLDVHNNLLKELPNEIGELKNLQVLNIENNQLPEVPASIGELKNLQTLLAKDNKLNSLPDSIKGLHSLRTIDVSGTNIIRYLPKNLCHVNNLEVLVLSNSSAMEYPPSWICEEGLESIMKFICKDCGVDYVPPSHGVSKVLAPSTGCFSASAATSTVTFDQKSTSIDQYNKTQEEKRKRQVEFERSLLEEKEQQARMAVQMLSDKEKNEKLLKMDIDQFEKSIKFQHERGEKERMALVEQLNRVEQNASSVIKKLLNAAERAKKQEELMERMERERMEQEDYFRVTQADIDALRKKETLAAMESMIAESEQYDHLVAQYLREQSLSNQLTTEALECDDALIRDEVRKQQQLQGKLVSQVINEERFQREAFMALQRERDVIQRRIGGQIEELQQELILLTKLESERLKLKEESDKQSLGDLRMELSELLMVLLKEKDEREEQLRARMVEIEEQKEGDNMDFWLVQYQRLLDSKPEKLIQKESVLDVELMEMLIRSGGEDHVTTFARHNIDLSNVGGLDEQQLRQMGVYQIGVINNFLREVEEYVCARKKLQLEEEEGESGHEVALSAPEKASSQQQLEPTAPPVVEDEESEGEVTNECVVCMDAQSNCVLLPCAHVCVCFACAQALRKCPMCRLDIQQKIRIFKS